MPTVAMPMARPTMEASAMGELKQRRRAEFGLQSGGQLEDAAFAFDFGQIAFAAAIGDVFAEHDHAVVAAHLLVEGAVDQVGHGPRFARGLAGMSKAAEVGSTVSE